MQEHQKFKWLNLFSWTRKSSHEEFSSSDFDHFQHQPWYGKLWRYRFYLRIPYDMIYYRFRSKFADGEWSKALSIAIADAHYRMSWFFTLKEAEEYLRKKD